MGSSAVRALPLALFFCLAHFAGAQSTGQFGAQLGGQFNASPAAAQQHSQSPSSAVYYGQPGYGYPSPEQRNQPQQPYAYGIPPPAYPAEPDHRAMSINNNLPYSQWGTSAYQSQQQQQQQQMAANYAPQGSYAYGQQQQQQYNAQPYPAQAQPTAYEGQHGAAGGLAVQRLLPQQRFEQGQFGAQSRIVFPQQDTGGRWEQQSRAYWANSAGRGTAGATALGLVLLSVDLMLTVQQMFHLS